MWIHSADIECCTYINHANFPISPPCLKWYAINIKWHSGCIFSTTPRKGVLSKLTQMWHKTVFSERKEKDSRDGVQWFSFQGQRSLYSCCVNFLFVVESGGQEQKGYKTRGTHYFSKIMCVALLLPPGFHSLGNIASSLHLQHKGHRHTLCKGEVRLSWLHGENTKENRLKKNLKTYHKDPMRVSSSNSVSYSTSVPKPKHWNSCI